MDCKTAARRLTEHWDGEAMSAREREELGAHLRFCMSCSGISQQNLFVRGLLKSIATTEPPVDLGPRLRALAARDRASKVAAATAPATSGWNQALWNRLKFQFKDAMGPLAVPLATGICSAVFLFSMLVPNFTAYRRGSPDVPTVLSTEATVKNMAPLGFSGEAVVDLTVDGNGRAVEYSIVSERGLDKQALRRGIENTLLFTIFNPGTAFGQPVAGKIRLTFRNSEIEVRG